MLRLAICDDEPEQRAAVCKLLRDYAASRPGLAVKLSAFSTGWELLNAVETAGGFDLYVLDVVMPELSGIDLGVWLRKLSAKGLIIYLTISPEYAVASYEAQAFQYLVKPVERERLFQVLDQAVARMEKERAACIAVKTKTGLELVRMDEIVYIELENRALCYHLFDGRRLDSVTVRGSFREEVEPVLKDPRFFQCSASFVANLFYVTAVERGGLRLDGGGRVPLARGRAIQAKQRWSGYWLGGPGEGIL